MKKQILIARPRLLQTAKEGCLVLALLLISWAALPLRSSQAGSPRAGKASGTQSVAVAVTDPWTQADLIQPEELARILRDRKGEKPTLVYVGFPLLYEAGRIPGAEFFGPGRSAEGLASLKKWARGLRPNQPVVMYCGCCPWRECPNVRPAFKALREAGLKRLRLLYIPTNLVRDWVDKGYPFQKGS